MKTQLRFQRHELKYYIPEQLCSEMLRLVRPYMMLDPYLERDGAKSYLVRSLYLDTDDLRFYHEKLAGLYKRRKFRIRGYNDERSNLFFEIKRRCNGIILITHRFHVGEIHGSDFLLRFRVETASDNENSYQYLINKYLKQSVLVNMATVQQGSRMELAFSVKFKDSHKQHQFLRELNDIPQVEQAMLVAVDEGNE